MRKGFVDGKLQPDQYASVYGLCYIHPEDYLAELKFLANGIVMGYFLAQHPKIIGENLSGKLDLLRDNDRFISLVDLVIKNHWIIYLNIVVPEVKVCEHTKMCYTQAIVPAFGFFLRPLVGNVDYESQSDNVIFKSIEDIKEGDIICGFGRQGFMDCDNIPPQFRIRY